MIRSFSDKATEALFRRRVSKGMPGEVAARAYRVLARVDAASTVGELRSPPSHRLHPLHGDQAGRWSVSVNMQYRITFRFEDGDAFEVRFEDYH